MRPVTRSWLALALVGGCYRYTPAPNTTPSVADVVRLDLTTAGNARMASVLGRDAIAVEGSILAVDDTSVYFTSNAVPGVVLVACSAASADAAHRGFCPIFPFNLFCLKLFKFWRAALGPRPQMFGSINCSGGSTDSSDRLHLGLCLRRTRSHCLPRSYL